MMRDILLTPDCGLMIESGDFAVGDSTLQNQALILTADAGEFKQYPLTGVGLNNYLLDERFQDAQYEARKQLMNDGMTITRFKWQNWQNIDIKADYGKDNGN